MNEIERKVDLLVSGIVLPPKRTRRRVVTIATTILIASVLIASASFLGFYTQMSGPVHVEHLLTIDGSPAVDLVLTPEDNITVVPGCTKADGNHTLTLNSGYNGAEFSTYFHITVTETTIVEGSPVTTTITNGLSPNEGGLLVTLWEDDGKGHLTEIVPIDGNGTPQIKWNPSDDPVTVTFEIHVTADVGIDSTSTYGYIITMDWKD